jgi:hypothetical protein
LKASWMFVAAAAASLPMEIRCHFGFHGRPKELPQVGPDGGGLVVELHGGSVGSRTAADLLGGFVDLVPFFDGEVAFALGQKEFVLGRKGEHMDRPGSLNVPRAGVDDDLIGAVLVGEGNCRGGSRCAHWDAGR